MDKTRVAIMAELGIEIPPSLRKFPRNTSCQIGDYTVYITTTGIGQKKAREATQQLCSEFNPSVIFFFGIFGAINETYRVGDVVLAEKVDYKGNVININNLYFPSVQDIFLKNNISYQIGRIETSDKPVTTKAMTRAGTDAVDMESYMVADVATKNNTPLVIMKAISDIVPAKKPLLFPSLTVLAKIIWNYNVRNATKGLNDFAISFFRA